MVGIVAHPQTHAVISEEPQTSRRRKVNYETCGLEDPFRIRVVALGVPDRPRRLHAERGLKVTLRGLEAIKHEDGGPLGYRDAGQQLATGKCDRLSVIAITDGVT